MKIKFENCEVEIWKLSRNTLVAVEDKFTFINDLTSVDLVNGKFIARIYVENMGYEDYFYSDEITWLQPH